MNTVWRWLGVAVLALGMMQAASGRPARVIAPGYYNDTPPPPPKAAAFWKVDAVDVEGKAITLTKSDGKTTQKYKVMASTRITINGQHDKLENIQAGMKVENMTVSSGQLSALTVVKVKDADSGDGRKTNKS